MNYYNIQDRNLEVKVREIIDIWITASSGAIFIKNQLPKVTELDVNNLTLQIVNNDNILTEIKNFIGLEVMLSDLTTICSQVVDTGKEHIQETEYVLYLTFEHTKILENSNIGSFIDYRELEDRITRYKKKSNHFYDVYYTLLTYLDGIYNK